MIRGDSLFTWDKFNDNEDIRAQAMQSAAAGGPNSGFELPDTSFFKQPELANELPDMKDDIDLIIATESYVNRLVDFHERLKASKGMSRGMAYELIELVPDLESYVKPNGFTEVISGVGYKPSLESISSQMWVVIAAAAAVLAALIYKFLSWLFGGGGNGSSGSGSLNQAEEGIRESEKKVEKQGQVLDKVSKTIRDTHGKTLELKMPSQISHDEIRRSTIPEALQDQIIQEIPDLAADISINPVIQREHFLRINLTEVLLGVEGGKQVLEYMHKPSRYARVIFDVTGNSATEMIAQSFAGFSAYSSMMLSELQALEEAFAFTKGSASAFSEEGDFKIEFAKQRAVIKSLAEGMDEKPFGFKIGSQTFVTSGEWAHALTNKIHEVGSNEPNFNDLEELLSGYQIGVRRLRQVDWRGMITFIELLKKSQPILEHLESLSNSEKAIRKRGEYEAREDDDERQAASRKLAEENAQYIIKLQRNLTVNYAGLMRVYAEISRVYVEVTKNATDVVNVLRKNAAGIVALYNKVKEAVPPSLEDLVDDLSELSKEANESQVNQHMLPFVSIKHMKVSFGGSDDDEDTPSITMSTQSAEELKSIMGLKPKSE